ncbi:MAG: GNAT family N-acetyltransferase [Spirochaetaceae bacterium]|nr:GNAT family N-acetyltransferase [Spirochaetaceae bacterium]
MAYEIIDYGALDEAQQKQAVELFMEGFGSMMTFSKDSALIRSLLVEIFDTELFKCYVEGGKVFGLIGVATNKVRPLNFKLESCVKYFGNFKGHMISSQMNGVFQKPVVKFADELYIDVLVTGSEARRKGVGSALLNYAFALKGYNTFYVHVFSKNLPAIKLYEKNGFIVEKREKFSLMRFMGNGYPVKMRKTGN